MSRSKLLGAAFALPLMIAAAGSAQANIIALTIDGSGSISSSDWTLQKQGYANALTALLNTDGSNSIGVWKFDQTVTPVFTLQVIDSAAKKATLIADILAMSQPGGNTAIGNSITTATSAISGFAGSNCVANPGKCIIDVSTDGVSNTGTNPQTATNSANTAGIKVNCLGVGGSADCSWNNTGLDFNATSAAVFEAAITTKLSIELTKTPEPITLSLFGAGLAGAAALRRRKNAKTA